MKATVTFHGKYNGRSFGSEKEFKDEQHLRNYIEYMERRGFNLDEVFYNK